MCETRFTKVMEIGVPTDYAPFCVDGFCNNDGKRFEVCSVWGCDESDVECEQSKANAHLIAAAPELYGLLEEMSDYDECQRFKKQINQLLEKARGEHV